MRVVPPLTWSPSRTKRGVPIRQLRRCWRWCRARPSCKKDVPRRSQRCDRLGSSSKRNKRHAQGTRCRTTVSSSSCFYGIAFCGGRAWALGPSSGRFDRKARVGWRGSSFTKHLFIVGPIAGPIAGPIEWHIAHHIGWRIAFVSGHGAVARGSTQAHGRSADLVWRWGAGGTVAS